MKGGGTIIELSAIILLYQVIKSISLKESERHNAISGHLALEQEVAATTETI